MNKSKLLDIAVFIALLSVILFGLKVALGSEVAPQIKEQNKALEQYVKTLDVLNRNLMETVQLQNQMHQVTTVKEMGEAMEYFINSTILACANLFDSGDGGNQTKFCGSAMHFLDNTCRDQYYSFCFGRNWVNYDLVKHVNPSWCGKEVDC